MSGIPELRKGYEVLIVGGGPAGMMVALSQAPDTQVLVIDRRSAPWRKPCDGILTPMSLRLLETIPEDPLASLNAIDASSLRLLDCDNHRDEVLPLRNHRMVDREAFDSALHRCVQPRAGAAFLDRTRILGWVESTDGFQVRLQREMNVYEVRSRYLVDASGAAAVACERAGKRVKSALVVQLWYLPQGEPQRCDWIFDKNETPYYLWVVRKPEGMVLGGVFPQEKARAARATIETGLARTFSIKGKPWRVQAARMAMPTQVEDLRLSLGSVLVVGEAAGLINVGTGEGISFALRSGSACGRAITLAGSDRVSAAALYAEFASPLVEEALTKMQHARRLFRADRRAELVAEEILVSVPRVAMQMAV